MTDAPKIILTYWAKPIPTRSFDWCATFDDYDPGEPDGEGGYIGSDPIGYGATEEEARADLLEQADQQMPEWD